MDPQDFVTVVAGVQALCRLKRIIAERQLVFVHLHFTELIFTADKWS